MYSLNRGNIVCHRKAVLGVATVDVLLEVVSSVSLMSILMEMTLPPCFNKLCMVLDGTEVQ